MLACAPSLIPGLWAFTLDTPALECGAACRGMAWPPLWPLRLRSRGAPAAATPRGGCGSVKTVHSMSAQLVTPHFIILDLVTSAGMCVPCNAAPHRAAGRTRGRLSGTSKSLCTATSAGHGRASARCCSRMRISCSWTSRTCSCQRGRNSYAGGAAPCRTAYVACAVRLMAGCVDACGRRARTVAAARCDENITA